MNPHTSGRIGGLTRASKPDYDGHEATAPAFKGLLAKFLREADPEGKLPEAERQQKADRLLHIHMIRLAEKSAAARRRR